MGGEASGFDRLDTEVADCDSRGDTKTASNASLYTPFSGSRTFTVNDAGAGCAGGGSGVSSVTVSGTAISGYPTTFTGSVVVPAPVTGVLQDTVGARARVGLTFYNTNTGGVRPGRCQRHEPQQRRQPYQHHPAHHEYAAGRDACGRSPDTSPSRRACSAGRARRYASGDFTIGNAADPMNYGDERKLPGGRSAPRASSCTSPTASRAPTGICRPPSQNYASGKIDLQLQRGELPLRRET